MEYKVKNKPRKIRNSYPYSTRPLHPIDKEIIRALSRTKVKVTPSQISRAIGVHPVTVQTRIRTFPMSNVVRCSPRGNRTYCKLDRNALRKLLKRK